jgi:hypothetical protein
MNFLEKQNNFKDRTLNTKGAAPGKTPRKEKTCHSDRSGATLFPSFAPAKESLSRKPHNSSSPPSPNKKTPADKKSAGVNSLF